MFQSLSKVSTSQIAHNQVCPVRITPIVVEGYDVGVLQPGHNLCFSFESSYELSLIGEAWQNYLNCHLSPNGRLVCPVNNAESACADSTLQFVALY